MRKLALMVKAIKLNVLLLGGAIRPGAGCFKHSPPMASEARLSLRENYSIYKPLKREDRLKMLTYGAAARVLKLPRKPFLMGRRPERRKAKPTPLHEIKGFYFKGDRA